jgi:hypothetical protein
MDIIGWLSIVMRFLHIGSAAGLAGGALYARLAATPMLNTLPSAERAIAAQEIQNRFKGVLFTLLLLVVASGLYNGFGPSAPHHSSQWQMWFGIKMLFVLHMLATSVLWAISPYGDVAVEGTGKRRLLSLSISAFAAILIADYLRYLTAHNL